MRCDATFSERQPLHGVRIETAKAAQVVSMLFEGIGVNAVARLTGLSKDAVLNVLNVAGEKCERFLHKNVRNVAAQSVQVDELYSFVARRPEFVHADDPERGEFFCFLSMERNSKLIINHHVGKRTSEDTVIFIKDLKERTQGHRFQLSSDGFMAYTGYTGAVFQTFKHEIDYGVEIKQFGKERSKTSSNERVSRKFNRTIVKWVKRTPLIGSPVKDEINTSHAERLNLTMRLFNRRFTRCTLGYSKKLVNHKRVVAIFICLYNFCRVHSAIKMTPAQAAGLTDHKWTAEEILSDAETA
jgi:IS1 family transposase